MLKIQEKPTKNIKTAALCFLHKTGNKRISKFFIIKENTFRDISIEGEYVLIDKESLNRSCCIWERYFLDFARISS